MNPSPRAIIFGVFLGTVLWVLFLWWLRWALGLF